MQIKPLPIPPPALPGVYRVTIRLHGRSCPALNEPTLFAYYDGVDTWSNWEFSVDAALRAKPNPFFHVIAWQPL